MRRTLAGEFIMVNKYLMMDLMKINMWNDKIKNNKLYLHDDLISIDKYINTNINDIGAINWSIFVWVTQKLEA